MIWAYFPEAADQLRTKICRNTAEIRNDSLETDVSRQFRRWVCRLDDDHDYWEECVFTDDILEDWTSLPAQRILPVQWKLGNWD